MDLLLSRGAVLVAQAWQHVDRRRAVAQTTYAQSQTGRELGMAGLREVESTLPPGFRFYPSDQELVCHYLFKKVANERASQGTLVEVDLHAREPWELPEVARLTASEWYFFSFRDRKYATGSRTNRATKSGYWKATGKDREVRSSATRAVVGMRKTLVFYQGRAKTSWVMHEFRLDSPHLPPREDWVLCRVFEKPKGVGEQDNAHSSSSPTFAGCSQAVQELPPVLDASRDQMGLAIGFVPQQEDSICGSNPLTMNAAMWQQYNSVLLDQVPQDEMVGSSSTLMGLGARGGVGDECGFFFDSGGFEDVSNFGWS
uniref:Uncharacterized protein n=1 Tax=Avena sativa TaxID=4498 RepID=A0ACD5USI5_AVESA